MAANNYYLGLTMAQADTINNESVAAQASTNAGPAAGTAADIEVRIQPTPGPALTASSGARWWSLYSRSSPTSNPAGWRIAAIFFLRCKGTAP